MIPPGYRHGRLTECFESAGGNAAAATFIVIDSKFRGQGCGRHLMKGLEKEAERLGYHYVYLWTKTAIPFYQNIGYQECQRVSLKRACLKSLDASQVETLEALLFRKSQRRQQGEHQSSTTTTSRITSSKKSAKKTTRIQAETIMLPPSNDDEDENAQDVWLRKRLVEHVGSIHVPSSQRQEELADTVSRHAADSGSPPPGPQEESLKWRYFLLSLPWQKQIGPSCGLAALRMIREYFFSKALDGSGSSSSRNDMDEQHALQLPSLLGEAQERGYTQDGEVFNANHLMDIAETVCGLDCEMWSTKDLQPQQVWNTLRDGAVLLLPYDSNARTRRPALLGGKGAHYGIIVGLLVGTRTGTIVGVTKCKDEMPILEVVGGGEERSTAGFFVDFEAAGDDDDPMCYYYLLVQHSLSSRLSIARWSDFLLSNQQLDSVDHDKYSAQDLDLKNRVIHCRGMRPDAF